MLILLILLNTPAVYASSFEDYLAFSGPHGEYVKIMSTNLIKIPAAGFSKYPEIQVSFQHKSFQSATILMLYHELYVRQNMIQWCNIFGQFRDIYDIAIMHKNKLTLFFVLI